ncbi:MAG: dihydroxyacetone kinase subunit DhaK [Lachnospiraceae bacterium]
MKKIINKPETVVMEMCNGIALAHPQLEFIPKYKIIKKKKIRKDKVTLISGGGSGHEPAHAGYIGTGMLDAAICGDVFASPSQIQVYQGIKHTKSEKGTLLIIKNYSGDMMNFSNAAAMAAEEDIDLDFVKVEDDIAVKDSLYTVGRRGVAGTVLVHKIAGAAAEEGLALTKVKSVAQHAADSVRSIGFALSSCVVPAAGVPTFEIGSKEMEYGVGIHGEPGRSRETAASADELAKRMTKELTKELGIKAGDTVTVLVNGFGSSPLQELYILNQAVYRELADLEIQVYRSFVGNYMTSIDMLGASLSMMKMDDTLKKYMDIPCYTPGFTVTGPVDSTTFQKEMIQEKKSEKSVMICKEEWKLIRGNRVSLENLTAMIIVMSEFILSHEVEFCRLDSHAGDGDFGMSVAKGFRQVQQEWDEILADSQGSIKEFLLACSVVIMEHCGGASGPIWGSAFRAAALRAGDVKEMDLSAFAEMMQAAVKGVQTTGERSFGRGAVVGDKTLIDALVPCADALCESAENKDTFIIALQKGAKAAVKGAEATKDIVAKMGRAGVVGERSLGYPDAGAFALGEIFTAIAKAMQSI